ncbi:MAG: peptidoglycan DD-metalloendopeptidase family protein [Blastocatellia bacterium]
MTIAIETEIRQPPAEGASRRREEAAARRAANEFEAMLLSHLTAAINASDGENEEEGLFGDSATGFYRQMFSEQMARTMADRGGVGLSEAVLRQLGVPPPAHESIGSRRLAGIANLVSGAGGAPLPERAGAGAPATAKPDPNRASASIRGAGSASHTETVEIQIPIEGRISSRFGERRDPINGRPRLHGGIDIAVEHGTPIPAAAAGTVVFAGRRGGYGNLVEIEHADGRVTRYAHADRIFVSPGDSVQAGQSIATVGSTGHSTGPHLHFEVAEDGARVDPLRVMAKDSALPRR